MSKKSVAVRIAGHDYKILSDGDPASLREIAKHVDQAMGRVRKRTGTVDTLDVAVLTCLNLAREIFALRAQENAGVDGDRMRSLIDRVEAILGAEKTTGVEDSDEARGTSESDGSTGRSKDQKSAHTLDLPSVEALRDRATASSQQSVEAGATDASMSEPRVAAGGRERAS
jgi:cell division protein ZapA (FtsZ GTPase activity inhibitor)